MEFGLSVGEGLVMKRALPPLRRRDANGYLCRGCGNQVPKTRRTWCSNECRDSHYMALSTFARRKVFERDRGVCALCGADTEKARRIAHWLQMKNEREAARLLSEAWGARMGSWFQWPRFAWEADHIVPLVEGGTNDLANYRTLCRSCHKNETAALAKRRAQWRRGDGECFADVGGLL